MIDRERQFAKWNAQLWIQDGPRLCPECKPEIIPFPYIPINLCIYPENPRFKVLDTWKPYNIIIKDLEEQGWYRFKLIIDETSTFKPIIIYNVTKGTRATLLDIRTDILTIGTVMGQQNMYKGFQSTMAYAIRARFVDSNGIDINFSTKIEIVAANLSTGTTFPITKVFYGDISSSKNQGVLTDQFQKTDPELYRFKRNIVILPNWSLRFIVINPDRDIDGSLSQLSAEVDGWGKDPFPFLSQPIGEPGEEEPDVPETASQEPTDQTEANETGQPTDQTVASQNGQPAMIPGQSTDQTVTGQNGQSAMIPGQSTDQTVTGQNGQPAMIPGQPVMIPGQPVNPIQTCSRQIYNLHWNNNIDRRIRRTFANR